MTIKEMKIQNAINRAMRKGFILEEDEVVLDHATGSFNFGNAGAIRGESYAYFVITNKRIYFNPRYGKSEHSIYFKDVDYVVKSKFFIFTIEIAMKGNKGSYLLMMCKRNRRAAFLKEQIEQTF